VASVHLDCQRGHRSRLRTERPNPTASRFGFPSRHSDLFRAEAEGNWWALALRRITDAREQRRIEGLTRLVLTGVHIRPSRKQGVMKHCRGCRGMRERREFDQQRPRNHPIGRDELNLDHNGLSDGPTRYGPPGVSAAERGSCRSSFPHPVKPAPQDARERAVAVVACPESL
jgi:hypothetical protein